MGSLKSEKIGSLQIHTGYLTFSLKKPGIAKCFQIIQKSKPTDMVFWRKLIAYELANDARKTFLARSRGLLKWIYEHFN